MIDWTYIVEAIIVLIIVSIIFTLLKKAVKMVALGIVILLMLTVFSVFLINQDLKTFDDALFRLTDEEGNLMMVYKGELSEGMFGNVRSIDVNASHFELDEENTFDKALAAKLNGTDKENQMYLIENSESQPETAAYRLKPITKLILR